MRVFAQVSRFIRSTDQRFACRVEEEAFHLSQERYTLIFLQVGCICIIISLLVVLSKRREVFRIDEAHPECETPRRLFLMSLLSSLLATAIILCLTFVYRFRPILRGRWELITSVWSSAYNILMFWCLTPWFIGQYFELDDGDLWDKETRHSVLLTVMANMCQVNAVCFFGSIRSHRLIMLPAASVLSYLVLVLTHESPFPEGNVQSVLYLLFLCIFSFYGAWRHENHLRKEWKASRKVVEKEAQVEEITLIKQAFAAMAGTTSDLVLVLDSELRILGSEDMRAHEAYFGRPLGNVVFPQLLTEGIRERFLELLDEASTSHLLLSMPAEVELRWGIAGAQLVLIHTKSQSQARYLVGLHFNDPTPIQEAELRPSVPVVESAPRLPTVPELAPSLDGDETNSCKEHARLESVLSTTYTGRVFTEIDNIPECKNQHHPGGPTLKTALKSVARVGMAEHWLVPSSEIEVLPDKVLGRGGFSQVMLGRHRGLPVAVKVPRRAGTANLATLTTLVNEIRVLRHLRHSNIALFYGACIDPTSGHLALLYEVVSGLNGTSYVRTTLLKMQGERQTMCQAKLLVDIASALHYLHGLSPSIVHGDIKGDNVMVETRKDCPHGKLMDFGLSRIRTRYPRSLGGTRFWMAPELAGPLESRPNPMPSSDVYSFGWFIYFVSTFTPPAVSLDRQALAIVNPNSLPLLWPSTDGGETRARVEPLVTDCLRHDYMQRPAMSEVLNRVLHWLPESQEVLTQLGLPVVMLLLNGWQCWDEGVLQHASHGPSPPRCPLHSKNCGDAACTPKVNQGELQGNDREEEEEGAEEGEGEEEEVEEDDGYDGHSSAEATFLASTTTSTRPSDPSFESAKSTARLTSL